jgi:hypothetical protein
VRVRDFLPRLRLARERVSASIRALGTGGRVAAGLSTEGWAGGYRQALDDVEAMLRHGSPADPRGYWSTEGKGRS